MTTNMHLVQSLEHVAKETAELLMRASLRAAQPRVPEPSRREHIDTLRSRGISVIADFLSPSQAAAMRAEIDRLLAQKDGPAKRWTDALGCDKRIYSAERESALAATFQNHPELEFYRQQHSGREQAIKLVLAARMDHVQGNAGSGNGWHRDSPHRSQFKAIVYLSDVSADNGPFEYVPGTHTAASSMALMRKGLTRPNQYRFTDDELHRMIECGCTKTTYVAPAGTLLLVDTKGLHRGAPIRTGSRYAMTLYCFDGMQIPAGFFA